MSQERSGAVIVEIVGLQRRYPGVVAVDGLDLSVREGEIFGLLGRNGAGKTTTIETMLGLQRPDAGTVRVFGMDPHRDSLRVRQRVGAQLQEPVFHSHMRLAEALRFLAGFYERRADVHSLLEMVGLAAEGDRMYGHLSGGQRRRFLLALALLGDPDLIVLDEPTAGLDAHARQAVWALVREARGAGRTVILATHHLEEAQALCDRVAIIHRGRLLVSGTVQEVARPGPSGLEATFLALTADGPAAEAGR